MAAIQLVVKASGASASESESRGHRLIMDRPQSKGGGDAGMMGGEVLLSALGGCFISNLLAAALARDITISDVKAEILGEIGSNPSRFTKATMTVSARYPEETDFSKLLTVAERGCVVANTLKTAISLKIVVG